MRSLHIHIKPTALHRSNIPFLLCTYWSSIDPLRFLGLIMVKADKDPLPARLFVTDVRSVVHSFSKIFRCAAGTMGSPWFSSSDL